MTDHRCLTLLLTFALAGCGVPAAQAPAPVPDAGTAKLKGQCDPAKLPAATHACYGGCGNELGVGRPCSKGGGECPRLDDELTLAAFCGGDFSDTPMSFCTRPCLNHEACGAGALCLTDPGDPNGRKGCVPVACAAAPDGRSD